MFVFAVLIYLSIIFSSASFHWVSVHLAYITCCPFAKDGRRRRTPGGVYLYLVKNEVSKEQQSVIFQYQNLKQQKRLVKAERNRKLAAQRRNMEIALGLDTVKDTDTASTMDTTSTIAPVEADELDKPKPDVEEMEDEANGDDCLANPDPSANIELDWAFMSSSENILTGVELN